MLLPARCFSKCCFFERKTATLERLKHHHKQPKVVDPTFKFPTLINRCIQGGNTGLIQTTRNNIFEKKKLLLARNNQMLCKSSQHWRIMK